LERAEDKVLSTLQQNVYKNIRKWREYELRFPIVFELHNLPRPKCNGLLKFPAPENPVENPPNYENFCDEQATTLHTWKLKDETEWRLTQIIGHELQRKHESPFRRLLKRFSGLAFQRALTPDLLDQWAKDIVNHSDSDKHPIYNHIVWDYERNHLVKPETRLSQIAPHFKEPETTFAKAQPKVYWGPEKYVTQPTRWFHRNPEISTAKQRVFTPPASENWVLPGQGPKPDGLNSVTKAKAQRQNLEKNRVTNLRLTLSARKNKRGIAGAPSHQAIRHQEMINGIRSEIQKELLDEANRNAAKNAASSGGTAASSSSGH
jgi:hypothetical protein